MKYHGIWGPGVRLLQNQRFRNKALLTVICLILPMGYLITQEGWRHRHAMADARTAQVAMNLYRLVSAEMEAVGELGLALHESVQFDAVPGALENFAQAEERAYAALHAAAADATELTTGVQRQMLVASRARAEALKPPKADQAQRPEGQQHRLEALAGLERQFNTLRLDVLHELDTAVTDDEVVDSLMAGGLERLPALLSELRQANQAGARVYVAHGRHEFSLRLMESSVAMQLMTDAAIRDFQHAMALGAVDADLARQTLSEISDFAALTRRMAQASITSPGEQDVIAATGLDQTAYRGRAAKVETTAEALLGLVLQATDVSLAEHDARLRAEMMRSVGITLAGTLLMAYLLVCLTKVVGGGLKELCARVDALAQGDLSEKPVARGTDEVGSAMTALAQSIRRMNSLFEAVTQGVAAVSHASREVAVGNAGLSGRTGDIRRSIGDAGECARSSMEAMNRCGDEVERIAEHMRDVRVDAQRSRKAMGELQTRMQGLQTKSREIGRVVMLVESVAHQTRLLSLNASVEAARAGAAGKGFAVVAQEVRDLARRSEAAARKIAEIVQASVTDIQEGGMLTQRVGESVRLTDERVAEVSAIMGDIVRLTHTGRDQSQEVVGITRSVEESAGGNARMVDQLAHASADLREHGDNLKRSMQHFVFG
ncbi:MAG: methyl-accepting chemotaxis protein [Burkholderiales bacterium]|nr:methyl-accepting chemotaxis protein [Burkholderiales bacterium]